MSKKKRTKSPATTDSELLPDGVTLLMSLEGHQDTVMSVAFDPQGKLLVRGGDDGTVSIWDTESGELLNELEGHTGRVNSVAFHPQGKLLASGSYDETVRIWDAESGELLHALGGHTGSVNSVAFHPQGKLLASGSYDETVRIWDAESGKLLRELEGHTGSVNSVAFHPEGKLLASTGQDTESRVWHVESGKLLNTLKTESGGANGLAISPKGRWLACGHVEGTINIWDPDGGNLLRTLEGHTDIVDTVAVSADGRLLASKSNDDTIRIWNCDSWETIAVIPAAKNEPRDWVPALAFHPTLHRLATSGSSPDASTRKRGRLIQIWDLDIDSLLERRKLSDATGASHQMAGTVPEKTVHSTTAKIVLVGDSGVGKTGLGWRLAHGEYREHDSTHGQQFWVLKQLAATRTDGTQCEAVLWDLAGQPDYRLIHALSIQDADLALILFDPTDSRDPLGSAEYWLRQLPPECPKILVAARVDRGHPVLTQAELKAFCQRQGIAGGWISTSASTGEGLDGLLTRMKQAIPWDDKPAVSTDAVFKRIKDFVLTLKESRSRKQIIFTTEELRAALAKKRGRTKKGRTEGELDSSVTDRQILTAVRHLSGQGLVRMLTLSTGEERILLVPELMNNLAASMVLEARRNPRGLGAVEESRLFDNSYRFRELEALSDADQDLLLDGTITAFLANRLSYRCFREVLGEINLLVFPDLMNLKKPQKEDLVTEDGASYILSGSTENTFAALVVLLGYTNLFLRADQAHDVAWFESDENEICGVRQVRDDNERTLVLLFSHNVGDHTRRVFEGLVEQILSRRETHVRRLRPVKCAECGTLVDRAVMARRLKQGKSSVGCEECCKMIVLPPDEPLDVKSAEQTVITHEGAIAELRTKFEEVIYELLRLAQAEKRKAPTCFVSYAWGDKEHERWVERRLALDLEKAGIHIILDRWENAHPGASIPRFVDRIEKADRVLVVGSNAYRSKYDNKDPQTGTVVAAEMDLISARLLGTENQKQTVIPLILEGEPQESLPPALHTRVWCDFRNEDHYFDAAFELLLGLYGVPPRHPAVVHWKQELANSDSRQKLEELEDDAFIDPGAMNQALKRVGSDALNSAFIGGRAVVIEQDGQLVQLYADGTTEPYDSTAPNEDGSRS